MIVIAIIFTYLSGNVMSLVGDFVGWYIFCSLFLFFPLMFGSIWQKILSLSLFLLLLWLMNDDVKAGRRYYHKQVLYGIECSEQKKLLLEENEKLKIIPVESRK